MKNFSFYFENIPSNNSEIENFLKKHWGSSIIVTRGKKIDATKLPRVIVRDKSDTLIGLLTFELNKQNKTCEIVSINAVKRRQGIGTELLKRVEQEAKKSGCNKIWLITVNDNPEAAAFYSKRGYRLVKVHLNALEISRKLKPSIPKIGIHNIPLMDEWEFEKFI